jgi:putative ABC transport system substrate-binding protein
MRVPTVAMLITHLPSSDPVFKIFREGLRELGYEDGRNVSLRFVSADGNLDRLPALAAEVVRQTVDVIVCTNDLSTRTAQKATTTIPIVMIGFGSDPVSLGLIDNIHRPGGNTTGTYSLTSHLEGKRLEILKAALPHVSDVAVLRHSAFGRSAVDDLRRAAKSLDVRLQFIELDDGHNLRSAFQAAKRSKAGAVLLVWSPIFYLNRDRVAALALETKLPTVAAYAVENGAVISYGTDTTESFKRAAYYVDRVLKGAKPSELPVEQLSKVRLIINLKTARTLGITIPDSVLARADELIR